MNLSLKSDLFSFMFWHESELFWPKIESLDFWQNVGPYRFDILTKRWSFWHFGKKISCFDILTYKLIFSKKKKKKENGKIKENLWKFDMKLKVSLFDMNSEQFKQNKTKTKKQKTKQKTDIFDIEAKKLTFCHVNQNTNNFSHFPVKVNL